MAFGGVQLLKLMFMYDAELTFCPLERQDFHADVKINKCKKKRTLHNWKIGFLK